MKKFIVFTFIIFFNLCLSCTCVGKIKIKIEIKNTDFIFSGKILSENILKIKSDLLPEGYYFEKAEFTILILKKYKGEFISKTIKIFTDEGKNTCGINFLIGQNYIIYAKYSEKYFEQGNKVNRFLNTDVCSRTRIYEERENKKIIKYLPPLTR